MNTIKISIVLPIYNIGEYLDKCFESIVTQSMPDFEVIAVNDGSKDNSGSICDKWAAKDSRIQVIHKENEGVATARNLGIEKASGEYIYFIDPDDWITPDALKDNYAAAKQADYDIVIFGCRKESVENDKITVSESPLFNKILANPEEIKKSLTDVLDKGGRFSIWNKLFRREFLIENDIKFPKFKRGQDIYFTMMAFKASDSIIVNKGVYYVQNAFFSTAKFDPDTVSHHALYFDTFRNLFDGWQSNGKNHEYTAKLFALWFFHVIPTAVVRNSNLSKKEKMSYLSSIFSNGVVASYLKDIRLSKIKNKASLGGITILKTRSPQLLYIITKLKITAMEKFNPKFIKNLYNKK